MNQIFYQSMVRVSTARTCCFFAYYFTKINVHITGENGERVILNKDEQDRARLSVEEFGFNMVASDKISLTRNIPDTRLDEWVGAL